MTNSLPSALSPQPCQAIRLVIIAGVCVLALGLSACASSTDLKNTSTAADADKVLLDRGDEALKAKRWNSGRQYFTKLLDSYPQSVYRADAKLGVGDSYLGENTSGSFVFALNEYREFLAFYPTNPRADYAQFQLATVHFKQMLAPGRDQTETKEAIREFQTFVDHYPNSKMMADGKQRLREAKDRLSDYEYGVGMSYLRIRYYPGVVGRFKPLLETDPGYTRRDAVYFYLGDALEKTGTDAAKAEALPYYERLVKEFEKSQYLEEAKRRIEVLKATVPAAGL
jgi:outer membrane protein assembly factor BamD